MYDIEFVSGQREAVMFFALLSIVVGLIVNVFSIIILFRFMIFE